MANFKHDTKGVMSEQALTKMLRETLSLGPNTLAEEGWHPIFAVAITSGSSTISAVCLSLRKRAEIFGCNSE